LFLTQKSKQTLPTDRLLETQNKLNLWQINVNNTIQEKIQPWAQILSVA
jgi:hypothetical protein